MAVMTMMMMMMMGNDSDGSDDDDDDDNRAVIKRQGLGIFPRCYGKCRIYSHIYKPYVKVK